MILLICGRSRTCHPELVSGSVISFMVKSYDYYVYMAMNSTNTVIYIGVTNNLTKRSWEHKTKFYENSFTARYHVNKIVYFEHFEDINEAIKREKQLKRWHREWKLNLIKKENPTFRDLTDDWTG